MSEVQESKHWKRNLAIIIPLMAFSFGYYAYQQSCVEQHDRLMDPSIVRLILDPLDYIAEYENFKDRCSFFYNFEDPELVKAVNKIISSFEQYRVSDLRKDLDKMADGFVSGLQQSKNPQSVKSPDDFIGAMKQGKGDEYVNDLKQKQNQYQDSDFISRNFG
jgi:hypothetical protein